MDKNYNFAKGRSEVEYGKVFYNPATGEVYGAENYKIEVRGINHYLIDGKEEINIEKDKKTVVDLIKKYNTLSFVVEHNKQNKYLNELLESINIDLSKCAKPDYGD